ncbi:MAG TPA: fibronectin type III domain-containing protein [Candidatus Angelobacter sp.]|nr:fibronectin type III domain-containing protein [Candidatus Angelobacter sp.]
MKRHFSLAVLLALFASFQIMSLAAQDRRPDQDRDRRPHDERIIDGPVVERVGDTSATISWTTNTGGSSVVRYGTEPDRLRQIAQSPYADDDRSRAQNHRVQLNDLRPNTTYYFIVDSGQGEGTGTEARSRVERFTTRGGRHDDRDDHDRDHDRNHDRDQPPPK